jgi:hypothetical protein
MAENLELYEFPSDHVGRKTYVSVGGHSRSIPKYKTYRGADGRNHLLPEYGGNWSGLGGSAATYIPDKGGYLSPLDGKFVEGRAAHRDHMKRHDVIEAGDMRVGEYAGRDRAPMRRVGEDIVRAIQELSSR